MTLRICATALFLSLATIAMAQAPATNSLLISPGDELHISVLDTPELEQHARVTDTGEIPVQGVGGVKVAGLSPGDAASAIQNRYISSHFLNHPQVAVVVDHYATQSVTLIGEVRTPGAYPITTARPILDVIALGGGLNDVADRNILVERHGDTLHPLRYNVTNDAEEAISRQIMVYPGDTVVIPKAGIVYILGDVNHPGGYVMSNNQSQMSLLEALAMAGGVAKTAKLGHARLIRKKDHTDTQLSLGDIQKGKQADFAMIPGDILYVPFSYAKNIAIIGSGGIIGSAAAAAIYTTH